MTRHIDLSGQRREAEARRAELKPLHAKDLVNDSELHAAQIEIESTSRKIELLRRLMDVEAKACAMELAGLHERIDAEVNRGRRPHALEANMLRLEARLELLHSVH